MSWTADTNASKEKVFDLDATVASGALSAWSTAWTANETGLFTEAQFGLKADTSTLFTTDPGAGGYVELYAVKALDESLYEHDFGSTAADRWEYPQLRLGIFSIPTDQPDLITLQSPVDLLPTRYKFCLYNGTDQTMQSPTELWVFPLARG